MRVLATSLRFPEGPVALDDGSVVLMEIEAGTLTRILPDGRRHVVAHLGGGPNGAAIAPDGRCHVCNNGGMAWTRDEHGLRPTGQPADYSGGRIERVDLATGANEVLWGLGRGAALRGPNDIVFDADGGYWLTDLGKARAREIDRGSVYYASADGQRLTEVIFPMITPNGIALSPDGRTLYVAETIPSRLWRFELAGFGELKRARYPSPHGGIPMATLPGFRRPDSIAVEACGNICLATLGEGGISVISPRGEHVDFVPLPDSHVTNICFGGPDMRTAFITLSGTGRLIAMPWPREGLRLHNSSRGVPA